MDVLELWELYEFSNSYVKPLRMKWANLQSGLNHNATHADKQPLKDHIQQVENALESMPVEALSTAQSDWLEVLGINDLIGPSGLRILRRLLDSSTFDPATAANDAKEIHDRLNSAETRLKAIGDALKGYEWITEHPSINRESVEVRIVFKEGSNVSNPVDLKKATADLHDILRGVSLSTGNRVEDVSITAISKGSLIITLGTAYAITKLLAGIVSHVTGMTLDSMKTAAAYEELRQKRILTKRLEKELKDEEKRIEEEGRADLISKLVSEISDISPENQRLLERSVEKLLDFFKKGGDIEFLEPPYESESDEHYIDDDGDLGERLAEIRNHRREVLLLTNRVQDST